MSFPASLTTRTVKGRFVTFPAGKPAEGTVRFVLKDFMQGPTEDAFVAPFDVTLDLDANGEFSTVLPATDDPAWSSSSYKVVVTITNNENLGKVNAGRDTTKVLRSTLIVPHSETGPLDLADVVNIPAPVQWRSYIPASSKGAPGGVASLDETGKVPASQLPPASGGSGVGGPVSWDDVTDKPATFSPTPHTHSYSQVTDKPATYPPSTHAHAMSEVTGLTGALAGKADTTALTTGLSTKADQTALTTGLAGKSDTGHVHTVGQVTGLQGALDAKANTTDVVSGLAGKANTTHSHAFADITGKPATYPHDPVSWTEVTDKPATFPHEPIEWDEIQNKPTSFPGGSEGGGGVVDWVNITSKPATFPPSTHTHAYSSLTGIPASFVPAAHTHAILDVDGLDEALSSKATTIHTHAYSELTGIPGSFTPSAHTHTITDVTGLHTALSGKSDTGHTHAYSSLTGIPTTFTPSAHTHGQADITGLSTTLDGKSNVGHTHAQSDITGLTTALSTKADQSAVTTALASKADLVGGVIPSSQIPSIAKTDYLGAVASQAAMLALTGQSGDWVIRTDLGQHWIITGSDPSQLASWTAIPLPTVPVQTVNGQTGAVVLGKADIGLSNVDNTSDANKPVSTAQQTALNSKANLASPTFTGTVGGITKSMVGLGNVDNTADSAKPISTAQQAALDLKAPLASPTFTGTVGGITKSMVGLGNVDNTSDASKPVSTAQQAALDTKAPLASPALTGTPTAPTATAGTNTTQVATTAFVTSGLSSKADTSALTSGLAGKANTSHTHATSDVTGLDTALAGKASSSHTHAQSDITGLSTSLSAKQNQRQDELTLTAGDTNGYARNVTIQDDGTDSSTWINRFAFKFMEVGGALVRNVFALNEYGEPRIAPARHNTVALRVFVKEFPNNPTTARSTTVPLIELMDDRTNRNSLWGVMSDGQHTRNGIRMADVLVLATGASVPAGTPAGTVIVRT